MRGWGVGGSELGVRASVGLEGLGGLGLGRRSCV